MFASELMTDTWTQGMSQQPSPCLSNAVAWQVGKWLSFLGSALALSVMTVISVGIGYAFRSVPDALKSSLPIGQYLGVSLMVYFGVKTLRARHHALSTAYFSQPAAAHALALQCVC